MTYPIHDFIEKNHCDFCRIFATDARYRYLVTGEGDGRAEGGSEISLPPCPMLGEPILALVIAQIGLNPARKWNECGAGKGTPAGIVCECRDCTMECRAAAAAAAAELDRAD